MKNIFLLIFFIVAFTNNLYAQNPLVKQWDYRFGGSDADQLKTFIQCNDGGYLLGGPSLSDYGGDKTQATWGGYDFWIVKINSAGNIIWDKRFGGFDWDVLTSLHETSDNGFILGGYSSSSSTGDKTQNSRGYSDYWLVKIDSVGNKLWDRRYGGVYYDYLQYVNQSLNGNFILGGTSQSGISGDKSQSYWDTITPQYGGDFWVLKTNAGGAKLWDKRFGGKDMEWLYSIAETNDGGYLLGGVSMSENNGDKTQTSWGGGDFWVVKIDSMGLKQWDKRFGGSNDDILYSMDKTVDGGFILGGVSNSGIGGDKSQATIGGSDYWIIKIDSSGNKIWDKTIGGCLDELLLSNIKTTDDKGFLLSGVSSSPICGNKTETNMASQQIWIVKTDSTGAIIWDKTIFSNNSDQSAFSIQTQDGCYAFANYSNAGIGGYKTQPSWNNSNDYWIIKFCDTNSVYLPVVNLLSSDTSFCEKQCIHFTDLSTNNPTSWQWFFPGADTATSTLQNPTNICYNAYGSFDVTLIACNAAGCDTLVLADFINVLPNPIDTINQIGNVLYSTPAYTYQWYNVSTGIIPGATNQVYIVTQTGVYYCLISDTVGCIGSSNVITVTSNGELNTLNNSFHIQPNPFVNLVTISLPNQDFKQVTISVRNILGQELFINQENNWINTNTKSIDFGFLSKGIYMIEVVADDKRMVRKMVKGE